MFRTALRNVRAHKARLLLTVLAVMLGVAFVSGTLVFTNTISDAYQKSSAKGFDQIDVAVTPAYQESEGNRLGKNAELTDALLQKSANVPGAADAIGVVTGFTAMADKDGKLIGDGFQSQGGNYWGDKDPRYPLKAGAAPRGANEVAIDSETARRAGYQVGDTLRLSVDGPVLTPRISGIFTTDDGNVAAGGSLALFDTATAQKLFGKVGTYDEIDVRAAAGTSQTALKAALDEALPKKLVETNASLAPHQEDRSAMQVMVKTSDGASDATKDRLEKALGSNPAIKVQDKQDLSHQIAQMFTLVLNMVYGLLAMAVIVAVLGVINTLAMSVFERSQEIGMLRAIGLDRKGIKRMVRLESLVISLFGGVLGIGLGVFFGWAAGELLGTSLPTYELVLPWSRMAVFLLLAATVGVLAALWPARRAARLNMLTAIKSE
jgi:putative ABC transport system permease protein